MLKIQNLLLFFISLCLFSCIGRQAYYVSPFNGITPAYHTVPMRSDSIKSAFYLNGALGTGGANEGLTDTKFLGTVDISQSHNFGIFQAYYSLGFTAGSYKLKPYDSVGNNKTVNYRIINQNTGTYFFGGPGFDGGINLVSAGRKSEWRIFGVETSLRQEIGQYGKVRDGIPDSAATVVIRNRFFGTVGIFTDIVAKTSTGPLGFKFGWGTVLGNTYHHFTFKDSYFSQNPPFFGYFNFTVHLSSNKWTGYIQSNAAKKAATFIIGANYRIGKCKKF